MSLTKNPPEKQKRNSANTDVINTRTVNRRLYVDSPNIYDHTTFLNLAAAPVPDANSDSKVTLRVWNNCDLKPKIVLI